MRKLILATHGELSKGMHNSIKMIVGDMADCIETYSLYPGQSPVDYANDMKSIIEEDTETEFVFITDIKGGSVHTALMQLCIYKNVKLLSGMNMNLILDILLSFSDEITKLNCGELIKTAQEGITFLNYESLKSQENEDF